MHGDTFQRHPFFFLNQWTMPIIKNHPHFPWKCGLAWLPILKPPTGSNIIVMCQAHPVLVKSGSFLFFKFCIGNYG